MSGDEDEIHELEQEIEQSITKFQEKTRLTVRDISLTHWGKTMKQSGKLYILVKTNNRGDVNDR